MYGGGETGIRTLETVSRLHTFQACAFNHSATSPCLMAYPNLKFLSPLIKLYKMQIHSSILLSFTLYFT